MDFDDNHEGMQHVFEVMLARIHSPVDAVATLVYQVFDLQVTAKCISRTPTGF